ncbi:multidrug ABC transporter ATPase [Nitzschia inconspicua]|uniref:Multidrug ABC transporter ATPase n=1 Tax=Nitzschia inconspicua TaxID=303405 RepID=A0A9K3Q1S8_9STRA|nr:multidrug ABC transporter ATPase [Nitzschia inconspicua]
MSTIRGSIGICLQHDCLFPELTVREHISFFARVKGMYGKLPRSEAEHKVDTSIHDVALGEKSNTLSKNLSGGMKRKLSVAIAFCGDSEIVICDEPTSGMDPFSRRFTWNVLREYRKNRTIVLTTHFMEEADILGDRIAIMAEGRLRCQGSSLFLKKKYGVGYQLTIEKQPSSAAKASNSEGQSDMKNDAAIDQKIDHIVKGCVPEASLLTNVGTELSYQLPLGSASNFMQMFDKLDDQVTNNGIVTYGVGITTLDDVFLLVARGETAEKSVPKSAEKKVASDVTYRDDMERSARSKMDLESEGLLVRHIGALFRKRALNFKRDKKAWCCTTILPSAFVLVGFLLYAFVSPTRELDALTLDLNAYNVDITAEPRNPIVFSDSESFSCQPGKCIYEFPIVALEATNELYYYCGTQSYIGNGTLCSIDSYENIIDQITDAGAAPVATAVANVNKSSYSLFDSADAFAATQYGAIFYHHDLSSIVLENTNSSSIFDVYFGDIGISLGDIDITTLGPLLESAGINISDFNITALLSAGAELQSLVGDLFQESVDVVGLPYSEAAIEACLDRVGNYTTQSGCGRFSGYGYAIQYNFTAIHVAPLYQVLADEALIREGTGDLEFKIQSTIHPLPITNVEQNIGKADDAFIAWFLIILGFPFIAGSFAVFVVEEKQSKAKHLQTVAGIKPISYWLSTWLWDVVNYQIPCWITIALMFIFSIDIMTTTTGGVFEGILTLLVLFGPAAASFSYLISFVFSSPSICNLFLIITSFLVAFGGTLAVFILRLIGADPANPRESLTLAAEIVEWVLRFCPAFCLGRGLYSAINLESISFLEGKQVTVWNEAAILYEVIFLGCESVVYLILTMKIDEWSTNPRMVSLWKQFLRIFSFQWLCDNTYHYSYENKGDDGPRVDDDVIAEEQRILSGSANDDLIVLSQLTKVYDTGKKAVDSISLGIPPGQCFGLLGINGAGKTSTMAMLTAEFPPTSGDATLAGFSVTKEPEKTRRRVGYCPQFDALLMNLTGREHVELYASIKGVPPALVKEASSLKLAEVGLSEKDSDRLAAGYSGGMKRRLSLATATIGNPNIVFLDECSTGVDPVARREIWAMVSNMVSGGNVAPEDRTSVILTTHQMSEAEALCPRIGIMAGGRLRCLGSAQRLKNKFGQGYQIELKVKNIEATDQDCRDISTSLAKIAGVTLPEDNGGDPVNHKFAQSFLTFDQTCNALSQLTGDDYLTKMLNENDPVGYVVFKEAKSPTGIDLDSLAEFAATELRMRRLNEFIAELYPDQVLRERQDTKARYEVGSKGVHIGSIFAAIEGSKEQLMVSEYGVSQTSLEQVFNIFAAEAEKRKQGTLD